MNYSKIIKEIKLNGIYIYQNFYSKKDISEIKNLASVYPEKVIELEEQINNYFLTHNIKLPSLNNEYIVEKDEGLKFKEVKRRLISEAYFIP